MLALQERSWFATTFAVPSIEWTVGDVVRKLRKSRRWNVEHLAQAADVNRTTVMNLERGKQSDQRTLFNVAKALDVSVSDLYALAESTVTVRERDWLQLLRELTDDRREVVLKVARRELEVQRSLENGSHSTQRPDPPKTGTRDGNGSRKA